MNKTSTAIRFVTWHSLPVERFTAVFKKDAGRSNPGRIEKMENNIDHIQQCGGGFPTKCWRKWRRYSDAKENPGTVRAPGLRFDVFSWG